MKILAVIMVLVFAAMLLVLGGLFLGILRSLGRWNRNYQKLGKRYAGKQATGGVFYGYLLTNPGLAFDYGRTFCHVKNRKTLKFKDRKQTEVLMSWPDRRLRLEISSASAPPRNWKARGWKAIKLDDPEFDSLFLVSTNQPEAAQKLLSGGVRWQLEQLRRLADNPQLVVTIQRGNLFDQQTGIHQGLPVARRLYSLFIGIVRPTDARQR